MVLGEGLEIKVTYDSQVQGTLVRHSMQMKSFELPTLFKVFGFDSVCVCVSVCLSVKAPKLLRMGKHVVSWFPYNWLPCQY